MAIWYHDLSLDAIQALCANTLVSHLGIRFIERGEAHLSATMPVDARTVQPSGLLHGGASLALAESLGSIGAYLCVDPAESRCLGLEINANHVRTTSAGAEVTGTARPLHIGRRTHVWEVRISNATGKLVCTSRMTLAVIAVSAAPAATDATGASG